MCLAIPKEIHSISTGATNLNDGDYGKGSGPIWLLSLNCTGSESSLFDCPHYNNSEYDEINSYFSRGHYGDVAVHCPGIRLMRSTLCT